MNADVLASPDAPDTSWGVPRLFCLVSGADDLALLEPMADAGVDGFQVRDPAATTRELVALARLVVGAVRPHGARVVVNDRLDVALATGADGVHLGADDLSVTDAVRIAPHLLVGATCRDREQVDRAAAAGARYVGFGPILASTSKAGLPAPLGVAAVPTVADAGVPVIAIGGIDAEQAAAVRAAGAHGVAVIGALWQARDPVAAAERLVRAVG